MIKFSNNKIKELGKAVFVPPFFSLKSKNNRSFTLIDILIIISIIALVAIVAIITFAIPQFTEIINRSRDSAIKTEMRNIAVRATAMNAFNYPFTTVRCSNIEEGVAVLVTADPEITAYCRGVEANSPAVVYHSSDIAFCIKARLNIPIGDYTYWCVDSTGFNDRINSGTSITACTANNLSCAK